MIVCTEYNEGTRGGGRGKGAEGAPGGSPALREEELRSEGRALTSDRAVL